MQQWEYLFAEFSDENYVLDLVKEDGLLVSADAPTMYDYCAKRGEDGWEIVSTVSLGTNILTTFKRPIGVNPL
jgi:hypothetical protein